MAPAAKSASSSPIPKNLPDALESLVRFSFEVVDPLVDLIPEGVALVVQPCFEFMELSLGEGSDVPSRFEVGEKLTDHPCENDHDERGVTNRDIFQL